MVRIELRSKIRTGDKDTGEDMLGDLELVAKLILSS